MMLRILRGLFGFRCCQCGRSVKAGGTLAAAAKKGLDGIGMRCGSCRAVCCSLCGANAPGEGSVNCPKCGRQIVPGEVTRRSVLKTYAFDRMRFRDLKALLWECLCFPCQRSCLFVITQLAAAWMFFNSLPYLVLYSPHASIVASPSQEVTIGQWAALGGVAGPWPAMFVAACSGPLLALRCFEIASQTSNGSAEVKEFAKFNTEQLLLGTCVFAVFCSSAIPGMIISHNQFGMFTTIGIGVSLASIVVMLPIIAMYFVVDRKLLHHSIVKKWRGWLVFYEATVVSVSMYVTVYWVITTPSKWALGDLIYITITSKAAWIPLALVVVGTLVLWTGMMLLFVYLLFVYSRLLGHFTRWIVNLEPPSAEVSNVGIRE